MKRKYLFLIINVCVSFYFCLACQAENVVVEEHENTVFIFKNKYIVHEFCKKRLLIATAQGSSWVHIKLDYDFDNIFFIDEKQGWGVVKGEPMKLYVTKDGGENWVETYTFLTDYYVTKRKAVQIFDTQNYRTIAEKLNLKIIDAVNPYFIDYTGWFIDGKIVWKTSNDGLDWVIIHKLHTDYIVSVEEAIEIFGPDYQTVVNNLKPRITVIPHKPSPEPDSIEWVISGYNLLKTENNGLEWKLVYIFQSDYVISIEEAIEIFGEEYQGIINNLKPRVTVKGENASNKIDYCIVDELPLITILPAYIIGGGGWRFDSDKDKELDDDTYHGFSLSGAFFVLKFNRRAHMNLLVDWRAVYQSSSKLFIDNFNIGVSLNHMDCRLTFSGGFNLGFCERQNEVVGGLSIDLFGSIRWKLTSNPYLYSHRTTPQKNTNRTFPGFGLHAKIGLWTLPRHNFISVYGSLGFFIQLSEDQ